MNRCDKCRELAVLIRIRNPQELKNTIKYVREYVAKGVLIECTSPLGKASVNHASFVNLSIEGVWDDYLKYYFKCVNCYRMFSLCAETYHGVGGTWELLNEEK